MDRFTTKIFQTYAIDFEKRVYSKHLKIPLILAGLWPYQSRSQRKLFFTINQVILLSAIVPIMIFLVQDWGNDYNIMIENLVSLLLVSTFSICHWMVYVIVEKIEQLHFETSEMQRDLTDEVERRHFEKFLKSGFLMSFVFTAYLLVVALSASSIPKVASLLDIISSPNNDSRSHLIIIHGSYVFFEQQEHYYITSFHLTAVLTVFSVILAGATGALIINMEQTCGFFLITRLRNIVSCMNKTQEGEGKCVACIRYNRLQNAVELHNRTIELCDLLEESCYPIYFTTETTAVIVLAMLYVYILHGNAPVVKKTIMVLIILGIYAFLVMINLLGQRIIDYSKKVLDSIYLSDWYLLRPSHRKLLLFIMQRSQRLSVLTVGKIAILSVESFAQVMKMSTTYFTALASMKSNN